MIELQGVAKTYMISKVPVHAVQTLDLRISDGQFVSVVGHSGSGKSTLLSMIGGLARPDTGTVTVDGVDIWGFDDRSRSRLRNEKFGFIYQFFLLPMLTASENVLLPMLEARVRPSARRAPASCSLWASRRAGHLLAALGRRDAARRDRPRALNRPRLLLADEPTGELDEATESGIMELLQEINREEGTTIVMVTHSSRARAARRPPPAHEERRRRRSRLAAPGDVSSRSDLFMKVPPFGGSLTIQSQKSSIERTTFMN